MQRVKRRRKPGALKAAELAIAAPQVIALRSARMLAAGAVPAARDRREVARMSTEKVQAFTESMTAMAAQIYRINQEWSLLALRQCWTACTRSWLSLGGGALRPAISVAPLSGPVATQKRLQRSVASVIEKGLSPVHRRATANARRLRRSRTK
jgi:hypothetical protein